MDEVAELEKIAAEMDAILARFQNFVIAGGDQAKFTGLAAEALPLIRRRLGPINDFGSRLESVRLQGVLNYTGAQSQRSVEEAASIVRAAVNTIRREAALGSNQATGPVQRPYVSLTRLAELRAIKHTDWDLRKLIRLCEELNDAFGRENFLAVAMLLRAITDHVPPIFEKPNFPQYAATCEGSLRKSMQRLHGSLRDIADRILHQTIRKRESLPTATQVDFHQDLDVLLGEVVRVLR